jgi:hypothetical protein
MAEKKMHIARPTPRVIENQDYYSLPNGITCLQVIRYFPNNIGNAIKYLWRHGRKNELGISNNEKAIEDLNKCMVYIKDQIKLIEETMVTEQQSK